MKLRIVSGQLRGRRINAPRNLPVRPTTDRAKEGLFNILQNELRLEEISALDLFSGTGNISYELASRGCTDITAVENDRLAAKFIADMAERLDISGLKVIHSDALNFLGQTPHRFDFIFADPPYDYQDYHSLLEIVKNQGPLHDEGLLVVEHDTKVTLPGPEPWQTRTYGRSSFSFYQF